MFWHALVVACADICVAVSVSVEARGVKPLFLPVRETGTIVYPHERRAGAFLQALEKYKLEPGSIIAVAPEPRGKPYIAEGCPASYPASKSTACSEKLLKEPSWIRAPLAPSLLGRPMGNRLKESAILAFSWEISFSTSVFQDLFFIGEAYTRECTAKYEQIDLSKGTAVALRNTAKRQFILSQSVIFSNLRSLWRHSSTYAKKAHNRYIENTETAKTADQGIHINSHNSFIITPDRNIADNYPSLIRSNYQSVVLRSTIVRICNKRMSCSA